MNRLYVVAFPEIAAADALWVERLRSANDPAGHALLTAHFTFVFDCSDVPLDVVESELEAVAAEVRPIEFCLARSESAVHGGLHYVYLCPEEGAHEMTELHRRLHGGRIAACVDPEQQFTPHMTVCKTPDERQAAQLHGRLARDAFRIRGIMRSLTLGAVVDGKFERMQEIPLTGVGKT